MGSNTWGREIGRERRGSNLFFSSHFTIIATVLILLLGGALEVLAPSIISNVLPASYTSRLLASSVGELLIGGVLLAIVIVLRLDELAATFVIAMSLYVDWYLGLEVVSLMTALVLLLIFYLTRSPRHPWVEPRALWLWILFLVFALLAEIRGDRTTPYDLFYYPDLILGALIFFWLGTVVARDVASVRRLFKYLSAYGTLVALHTIILATTGTFLFRSSHFDGYLALVSNFPIAEGIDVYRLGAFFLDPNWNGTFFAVMLCIPLGLFADSTFLLGKILYLIQVFVIVVALLFTYSAGAGAAAFVGVIAFVVFAGRTRHRVLIPLVFCLAVIVTVVWFPYQIDLLLQHATTPTELLLRTGAWQTAWRVIQAFPLAGVGLGLQTYLVRADPYRVPAQYIPLDHPHNSYLELGAMAGLPVLIAFIALILFALWLALRNWKLADVRARPLLGAGIAAIVALSANSWAINAWTLPPLAASGWLMLGVISSPLLTKGRNHQMPNGGKNEITQNLQQLGGA